MTADIEFTDRYGGNYPDPATVCLGQCEGMGMYPVHPEDAGLTEYERQQVELTQPDEIGFHFITCSACAGTGKRSDG